MTEAADGRLRTERSAVAVPAQEGKAVPAQEGKAAPAAPGRRELWGWVWSKVRPYFGWVLAALGAVSLFLGWYGVSGEALTAKQLPYLVSGGLTGIALIVMAGVFLATDDVRRQLRRVDDLERKLDDLYRLFVDDVRAMDAGAAPPTASGTLVALPGGSSYHRSDCALVAGKSGADEVSAAVIARRSLKPCRICEPPAPN